MIANEPKQKVGRRKTAIARVKIKPGSGKISVNGKPVEEYFTVPRMLNHAIAGLEVTGSRDQMDVQIRVSGGGISGQSGAVRLGIARALQTHNPDHHGELKKADLLTRDPRMVERKKYGLRKARRGTQFSKR